MSKMTADEAATKFRKESFTKFLVNGSEVANIARSHGGVVDFIGFAPEPQQRFRGDETVTVTTSQDEVEPVAAQMKKEAGAGASHAMDTRGVKTDQKAEVPEKK